MPVPAASAALFSSQPNMVTMKASSKKTSRASRHSTHSHSASVLASLGRAPVATQDAVYDQIMMAPAPGHHSFAQFGHGAGSAADQDMNARFESYGGHHQHSQSVAHGVIGHHLSSGGVAPDTLSGEMHVHPQETSTRSSRRRAHDQQQHYRHSLSSWPPSPDCLPPTPSLALFGLPPASFEVHVSETGRRRDSMTSLWPTAPMPPTPSERMLAALRGGAVTNSSSSIPKQAPAEVAIPNAKPANVDGVARTIDGRVVDKKEIAKLMPSPSEIIRVVNDQARANAATYISDWFSEVVWELVAPLVNSNQMSRSGSISQRRSAGSTASDVPPPFKRFAHQTVYQVSASPAAVFLAIWYIKRLPTGPMYGAMGEPLVFTEEEIEFREDLLRSRSEIPWRMMVLGLMLANKWLEDNTFTNKTWNEVTGLSITMMRTLEAKALSLYKWELGPKSDDWLNFLQVLYSRELAPSPQPAFSNGHPSPIGSERRMSLSGSGPTESKRPIRVIEALMNEVHVCASSIEPIFPGLVTSLGSPAGSTSATTLSPVSPATSLDSFAPVSPATSLDSFAPMSTRMAELPPAVMTPPDVQLWMNVERDNVEPARPVRDDRFRRRDLAQHRVSTPAEWNPHNSALDPPMVRDEIIARKTRPMYEAVQRPSHSSLLLIPPPPQYEDFDYSTTTGAGYVPRAKYAEESGSDRERQDASTIPFPQHHQSAATMDRSWYDAKIPRSILSDVHNYNNGWASTFSGMIGSF